MAQPVGDAVARAMARPFEWGVCDCCTAACDVFRDLTGVDPMARLRGSYSGPASAMRIVRAAGGWLALAERLAREAGLTRADAWAPGALGLAPNGGQALVLVIGLDQPGFWAGKSRGGWSITRDVVAAWRS